jgi:hypothetical protein
MLRHRSVAPALYSRGFPSRRFKMDTKSYRLLPVDMFRPTVQLPPHQVLQDLNCVVLETFQAYSLSQR